MKFTKKQLDFMYEAIRTTEVMTDVLTKRAIMKWLSNEIDLREKIGKNSQAALQNKKDIA